MNLLCFGLDSANCYNKDRVSLQYAALAQKISRYWYNIAPISFQIYVLYRRVFIRLLIGPREFAERANVRDFGGQFTTSCEAQTRIDSKRRADTLAEVRDTVSGPTQLFLIKRRAETVIGGST